MNCKKGDQWLSQRYLNAGIAAKLRNTPLFQKRLQADIRAGEVFPALRRDSIDFYYKGGKLFGFDARGVMTTHAKYASVLRYATSNEYVTETAVKKASKVESFVEGYDRIKELCRLFAGSERSGVAEAFEPWSYAKPGQNGNPVILDVEVCLSALEAIRAWDRVDVLVLNPEGRQPTLRFIEAKCYGNGELVAKGKPEVVGQLERYRAQFDDEERRCNVLAQYRQYVSAANSLFGLDLPLPCDVESHVGLLIFGFDNAQKTVIKEKVVPNITREGRDISVYYIGNMKKVDLKTLWKKTSRPGHATTDS